MKFYLPTRDECQDIVKNSNAFYCTETEVEGFKVEIYGYRLVSHGDFIKNKAYELRGITFIYNPETGIWERNILMNKFFNINETDGFPIYKMIGKGTDENPEFIGTEYDKGYKLETKLSKSYERKKIGKTISWMYEDLKDKKIVRIQDKLDGSIISFIKFPDGSIRAKSKMSFESDQAKMAQKIYETSASIRVMINTEIERGNVPIFELVGYENQIVLQYNNPYELRLIQIRNSETGEYANSEYMNNLSRCFMIESTRDLLPNIQVACNQKMIGNILDYLMEARETIKGVEGWILVTSEGQLVKIKTTEYLQLHELIGPDAFRENLLIRTILNEQIDDVISQLVPGNKRDKVIELTSKIQHEFDRLVIQYKKLRGLYFNKYNEDRKAFASNHRADPLFGYVMKRLNTKFTEVEKVAEESVKEYIKKVTSKLSKAKEWIETI